ncbi:MAG: hypothetical protein CME62_11735 [Halobacteriovoraceae bacterium]|nr:hypothetical protein [Halobacteriovoraceae bacterium]|tara:strand:- start:7936 stop:8289 length:354 start_codon:yes stop_codon:yes gene_type:complete
MRTSIVFMLLFSVSVFAEYKDSFIVEVSDRKIKVTSPLKKVSFVSIIVKNETFDKIISEIRSEDKVLKRFVLKPEGQEVVQIDYSKVKKLFYVPVAPPFEAVELRFEQKPYEVPEKK